MASILIVDDEPNIREILNERLSQDGHSIATATDGSSAEDLLQTQEFDLIITDIIMPDVDGLALIKFIKANKPEIKVIAITAGGRLSDTETYLNSAKYMGADRLISKPFDLDDIAKLIAELLE